MIESETHLGARLVPLVHDALCLSHAHSKVLGQPVRRFTVREAEVQHLGLAALTSVLVLDERSFRGGAVTLVDRDEAASNVGADFVEHGRCRSAVEVTACLKRLHAQVGGSLIHAYLSLGYACFITGICLVKWNFSSLETCLETVAFRLARVGQTTKARRR